MFMRGLCQFSSRLPECLPWRAPSVMCGSTKRYSSNSSTPDSNRVYALRMKNAEEFLANLDEDGLKKMEEIKELMKQLKLENKRVPDEVPLPDWKRLLTELNTYSSRVKFLSKLYLDEVRKRKDFEKKQTRKKERQERLEEKLKVGLPQFSVHIPARDKEMKRWNGIHAVQSDVNVVLDLDFEQTEREQVHAFDQIQLLWSNNLRHLQPLNIHLTSVDKNERLRDFFHTKPSVFVNTHEEHFTEVFPAKDLVYLSPDGPQLQHFDKTCTYIIGGLVDLSGKTRLTFGTARKLGIRCASFPIKSYCDLSIRSPDTVLTLNCVYGILQDMFLYHEWATAFRNNLRRTYVLYEDTKSETFAKKRNEMIEKQMLKTFKRNQTMLR